MTSQQEIRKKLATDCLCSRSSCFEDCPACSQLDPEDRCLAEEETDDSDQPPA